MKRHVALTLVCLVVLADSIGCQEKKEAEYPSNFGQRAMGHVTDLVELGLRPAGSSAERDAGAYIQNQFEKLGVVVEVEPFEFETFVVKEAKLSVCEAEAIPKIVCFNPYQGEFSFEGNPVVVRPDVTSSDLSKLQIGNRLVITADPAPFFTLMFAGPRVIVYLEPQDYESVTAAPCPRAKLQVVGELAKVRSANVVATIGSVDPLAKEIVISAHYDSYRESPGADDNASGIGVLIELARYFARRGVPPGLRLRFVAFGAEELGVIGSRSYLDTHREELRRCILLLNLDQVGGPKGPYVEMTGGVSGVQDTTVENHFPDDVRNRAWEATDGRWKLVDPRVVERFTVSNRPSWLTDLVTESAAAVPCELIPTGNMGGDQQVFAQAGIVATSIGSSGNVNHAPNDTAGQVVVAQMSVTGRLAAEIIIRAMKEHLGSADGVK